MYFINGSCVHDAEPSIKDNFTKRLNLNCISAIKKLMTPGQVRATIGYL